MREAGTTNGTPCTICNYRDVSEDSENHKSSSLHRFNFLLWAYNYYRKALAKNRNGVNISIEGDLENDLKLQYKQNKGKYIIQVTPDQLRLHNKLLEFSCTVESIKKDESINLTSFKILDANTLSSWYDRNNNISDDEEKWLQIEPKATYNKLMVRFKIDDIAFGSFKIPLAFNFQTSDLKNPPFTFTVCRTIVVEIKNVISDAQTITEKSPFKDSDEPWNQVRSIVPAVKATHHINNYPVPKGYMECLRVGLKNIGLPMNQLSILQEIRRKLRPNHVTRTNYRDFFHLVLWLDEKVQELMLKKYNMENVVMTYDTQLKSDFLKLRVPGLAEKRPSLIVGDKVRIKIHGDHKAYEGAITVVENEHIQIKDVDSTFVKYLGESPEMELDVTFLLGRLPLERMHRGVDMVFSGWVRNLFPDWTLVTPDPNITCQLLSSEFNNQNILANPEQKMAVEKILIGSSQKAPYIIFGPPGTGKTVTIVEAIYQILKKTNKRILVCAPANAACDMLAEKLKPFCLKTELLREHSQTREKSTIPKAIFEYSNIDPDGNIGKTDSKTLLSYRIIVSTLILIGRFSNTQYHPDIVFIDEAAQAVEPEACVAIGLLKPDGRLVLAGDPKQLGPIVMSQVAANDYKFDVSLLERLMNDCEMYKEDNQNPNFITMLKHNFRSHPKILEIPNELFYQNKLVAMSHKAKGDPLAIMSIYPKIIKLHKFRKGKNKTVQNNVGSPIEFCAVSAKEEREGKSPSYFNSAEVNMVLYYIKTMLDLNLEKPMNVEQSQIGVITPYIRQVYRIKGKLKQNGLGDIEVGTTETFQGREKRIIIISTVRAQNNLLRHDRKYNLGFVKNDKRFNVAITRAESKLILIGCPAVLGTDSKWLRMIESCEQDGSYYGAPYERRTQQKINQISSRLGAVHFIDGRPRNS